MSSYKDSYQQGGAEDRGEGVLLHSWEAHTRRTLRWLYGPDYEIERRALMQADLAAWRRLGEGRPAA